ncbi:hypothetical protein EYF80_046856 [Liparis tanakae]|uniref:Uncharacterized protein n=1 Tax=Liparis tanakae TaxID=230148 RepID=A0A4Z2FP06_9TELE|nr:hypothetical protein EYF80_046856 [Liparis tanakae]
MTCHADAMATGRARGRFDLADSRAARDVSVAADVEENKRNPGDAHRGAPGKPASGNFRVDQAVRRTASVSAWEPRNALAADWEQTEALWRCTVSSSSLLPLLRQQNRATPSTAPPDERPAARRRFTFTANTSRSGRTPGCGTTHASAAGREVGVNSQHLNTTRKTKMKVFLCEPIRERLCSACNRNLKVPSNVTNTHLLSSSASSSSSTCSSSRFSSSSFFFFFFFFALRFSFFFFFVLSLCSSWSSSSGSDMFNGSTEE